MQNYSLLPIRPTVAPKPIDTHKRLMLLGSVGLVAMGLLPDVAQAKGFDEALAMGPRVLGRPDAPVTIIEYASMTCPYCARFHAEVLPTLKKEYIDTGKAKLEFYDFPLDGVALGVAMLLRCLPESRYFKAVDVVYQQQKSWSRSNNPIDKVKSLLKMAGLDDATAQACQTSGPLQDFVIQSRLDGVKQYGISGTPTVIIGDTTLKGVQPVGDYRDAIDDLL